MTLLFLSIVLTAGLATPSSALGMGAPSPAPVIEAPPGAATVIAHSHNDYEQRHPLQDALENRMNSVEADVWLVGGELMISHIGLDFVGSLSQLYLNPLQDRVVQNGSMTGSVYGDGKPFYLWLDIKDSDPKLIDALHDWLSFYPMLTRFTDATTQTRAVTVILTGNDDQCLRYASLPGTRYATRDAGKFSEQDPAASSQWLWYSLDWPKHFRWNGKGAMPAAEKTKLQRLVQGIHTQGRRVRFYGTPEREEFWQEALNARVDVLGTDDLPRLSRFLGR